MVRIRLTVCAAATLLCSCAAKPSSPSPQETFDAPSSSSEDAATQPLPSFAHIVAVQTQQDGDRAVFSVSIESADTGCDRYANWWELLSEDGSLLYRRILGHSHTDENGTTDDDGHGNRFTRSSPSLDMDVDQTIYVRAHMSDVGYNGDIFVGTIGKGFSKASNVSAPGKAVEALPPQPTGCAF